MTGELDKLRKENKLYRKRFGCLYCGELHDEDVMCPPHEVRTTGQAWFREKVSELTKELSDLYTLLEKAADTIELWHSIAHPEFPDAINKQQARYYSRARKD